MRAFFDHHRLDVCICTSTPGGELPLLEEDADFKQQWDKNQIKAVAYLFANHWVPVLKQGAVLQASGRPMAGSRSLLESSLVSSLGPAEKERGAASW